MVTSVWPKPAGEMATPQGMLAGSLKPSCWSMSTAQNSQPRFEGLLAASSQVTISPGSLSVSAPTSRSGWEESLAASVVPVLGSPGPEVPALAVPEPSVGMVSLVLTTVLPVVGVAVVGFVAVGMVIAVPSLADADSAGSPPQAPARRRSEGRRVGRVEVVIVRPGRRRAIVPEKRGEREGPGIAGTTPLLEQLPRRQAFHVKPAGARRRWTWDGRCCRALESSCSSTTLNVDSRRSHGR
jgi:hypothetical protein